MTIAAPRHADRVTSGQLVPRRRWIARPWTCSSALAILHDRPTRCTIGTNATRSSCGYRFLFPPLNLASHRLIVLVTFVISTSSSDRLWGR